MPFKCSACGMSFDAADEFMQHKLSHQKEREQVSKTENTEKKGLTCLNCGNSIPTAPYGADYRGDIVCPFCKHTIKVVIQDGEVLLNVSQGVTVKTKEDLLGQYRKWVLEYIKARDLIERLVPVPSNLPQGAEMPSFTVTEDLLAQFRYAGTAITNALEKRQEIHESMKRLQQGR